MAPDYGQLLQRITPDLQNSIKALPNFDADEWDRMITANEGSLALTPQMTGELQLMLNDIAESQPLGLQNKISEEVKAVAAADNSLAKADGGLVTGALIAAGTVFSLYVVNCVAVLINNTIKAKNHERTQDISKIPELPDFWSVAQEVAAGFSEWLKNRR